MGSRRWYSVLLLAAISNAQDPTKMPVPKPTDVPTSVPTAEPTIVATLANAASRATTAATKARDAVRATVDLLGRKEEKREGNKKAAASDKGAGARNLTSAKKKASKMTGGISMTLGR